MNSLVNAEHKTFFGSDLMEKKRQKKALRNFKEVLHHLVFMLRKASGGQTVYLYWINRERRQFVLESKATSKTDVVFQDRVSFEDHFLNDYKDIDQPKSLVIDDDIDVKNISHHRSNKGVKYIILLPFYNNEETVAITAVEFADKPSGSDASHIFDAYRKALGNVLNTYLELSDLYENQQEWVDYEESLSFLETKGHFVALLKSMLDTMQALLEKGGVSLVSRGMGQWINLMNAANAHYSIPLGLPVEHRSLAKKALQSTVPEFAIHFNQNPKKISPRELHTEGATLAIPMMFDDTCMGMVLAYDENPLVFSESTKHKLQNIVQLSSLKIQTKLHKSSINEPLLTNEYRAIIPDCWERVINSEIKRIKKNINSYHSWAGLITPAGLSKLRTQFRLEELAGMQRDLVRMLNPNAFGIPGFIGSHSDYIYLVFLQSNDPQARQQWSDKANQHFNKPVALSGGQYIETELNMSFKKLDAHSSDSYEIITALKKQL